MSVPYEATNASIQDPRGFITLDVAKQMTLAAQQKAQEIGVPMYCSIVDKGGNLVLSLNL